MAVFGDIDTQSLADAVKLPNEGNLVEFAFGKKVPFDEVNLNAFKIDELGDMQVPLSLKVRIWKNKDPDKVKSAFISRILLN